MKNPETAVSDRIFMLAFGASLGFHFLFIIADLLNLKWFTLPKTGRTIDVVYDEAVVEERDLSTLQEKLARSKRETVSSPEPTRIGERVQIRVPERPALAVDQKFLDVMPQRANVVDLTDLIDASRGDPVLLSFFGAIREQIQRAANKHTWLLAETQGGLVCVSFTLFSGGSIENPTVVLERSASSKRLQEVSLQIVEAAAPFPPFPPSLEGPSKVLVVPLEFSVGSSE